MCGITGIIARGAPNYRTVLQQMTASLSHRGPDAEHHEFFDSAALGHRRLSIIDLSDNGRQPMFSNTRNECLVLNGEIYGYQALKKKYSEYPYRSTADTEVILAMYREKGKDLIHELPGMFAFALWSEEKQELFCARDRFGEKPFYYATGKNGEFIFASEIKAILASGLVEAETDYEALSHYLQYGYVSAFQSIYRNIKPLPPAHYLTFANGKIEVRRYYSLPKNNLQISLSEAKEEFVSLLKTAVKKQLVADVEVGSFLSGGLDSSSIVALVSEFRPKQTTISYGYFGENSELKFATEIAEKYKTRHIEIKENRGEIAHDLLRISKYFEEPFADMSYTPQYKICEAAGKHLRVVLAGDVGDELFGGYHFYRVENEMRNHFSYNNLVAKFGLNLYRNLKQTSFVTAQNLRYKNILDFHQNHVRNYLGATERARLGVSQNFQQPYSFIPDPDSLNDVMRIDLEKYVPGNMLVKSDRMAMANSLEVRTPFLDKDFAEFCIALPDSLKINSDHDKIILRESMQSYWTETIKNRGKQGFGASVESWFEQQSLMDISDKLLKDKSQKVFDYIDFNESQKLLKKDNKHWNLLQLALWANNIGE